MRKFPGYASTLLFKAKLLLIKPRELTTHRAPNNAGAPRRDLLAERSFLECYGQAVRRLAMKFQTVTNLIVVVALAVNSFVLYRLSSELQEANRKLERADQVMAKAISYSESAEKFAGELKGLKAQLGAMTRKEMRAKAKEKLGDLLEDAVGESK